MNKITYQSALQAGLIQVNKLPNKWDYVPSAWDAQDVIEESRDFDEQVQIQYSDDVIKVLKAQCEKSYESEQGTHFIVPRTKSWHVVVVQGTTNRRAIGVESDIIS